MTDQAPHPPPFQFTLKQLIALIVCASAILALTVQLGAFGLWISLTTSSLLSILIGARRGSPRWVVSGAIGLALCVWLTLAAALSDPRYVARKSSCSNNLHNIVLALQQYHTNCGCYPPPFIADAKGKPIHSWRVLLLPYLEQKALYSQYRFDEPWDGPNNRKLHNINPKIFACAAQDDKRPYTETNYVVVVGPNTAWPAQTYMRDADIIDGLSNTVLVVEVADSGIHWMEPRDLHINQMPMAINAPRGQGISSHHPGGAFVAFADGDVRFLRNDIQPEVLRASLAQGGKDNDRLGPLKDGH
jgi:hypothetical protein